MEFSLLLQLFLLTFILLLLLCLLSFIQLLFLLLLMLFLLTFILILYLILLNFILHLQLILHLLLFFPNYLKNFNLFQYYHHLKFFFRWINLLIHLKFLLVVPKFILPYFIYLQFNFINLLSCYLILVLYFLPIHLH